jgi:hypothetical protein
MRVEIQIQSGHLWKKKKQQAGKQIDLQGIFNDYWTSTADEITVQGQLSSLTRPVLSNQKAQRTF